LGKTFFVAIVILMACSIFFAAAAVGTMVFATPYNNIRDAVSSNDRESHTTPPSGHPKISKALEIRK